MLRNSVPGRKSACRAAFRPDSNRESIKIGPPVGRRPARGPSLRFSRLESAETKTKSSFSNLATMWGHPPPPPYAREKVKIRLLRGRSDFDVLKNRQNL